MGTRTHADAISGTYGFIARCGAVRYGRTVLGTLAGFELSDIAIGIDAASTQEIVEHTMYAGFQEARSEEEGVSLGFAVLFIAGVRPISRGANLDESLSIIGIVDAGVVIGGISQRYSHV